MKLTERQRLGVVLVTTSIYFVAELVGGYLGNSLALISDAFHMLTDMAALSLGMLTLWMASRPAAGGKTYGYLRAEILGALLNGLMLWVVVAFLFVEALHRIREPAPVAAAPVMVIALGGLLINVFAAGMTSRGEEHHDWRAGIAMRSVFIHVISDLLGSIGVLIAGGVIYFTGWTMVDPLVSMFIGLLILFGSWGLIREGVDILMESVPARIDLEELRGDLLSTTGAEEVHDLHVWCLTSHEVALSAHAVVSAGADPDQVLADMSHMLENKFKIRHMTVQLERNNRREREPGHF